MKYQVLARCLFAALVLLGGFAANAQADPIRIAEIKRTEPVDYEKEILPILKRSCLACHSATVAESDLVMETPQTILKGGASGAAVEPKDSENSLLMMYASHSEEPFMPPPGNKVNAKNLTPEELGLIKLWIDQGATGTVTGGGPAKFEALPPGVNPIYAVALTRDGQYAACGRANQVFLYHVPTGRLVCRLTDPEVLKTGIYKNPGVAHLDLIQSLAFDPAGDRLASGGFQVVKLWGRPRNVQQHKFSAAEGAAAIAVSPDATWLAAAGEGGVIRIFNLTNGQPGPVIKGHAGPVTALQFSANGTKLFSGSADKSLRAWNVADGQPAGRLDTAQPVAALTLVGDGSKVATGGGDNNIYVWNAPAAAAQLAGLPLPATAMAASADRKWLAFGAADGTIRLVEAASGKVAKTLSGHSGAVNSLAFNAGNTRLVSSAADKTIRVWDVAKGEAVTAFNGGLADVGPVALHPGGNQAASANAAGLISLWKLDVPAPRALAGDNGAAPTVAAVSLDGKWLAVDGAADGKPVIFLRDIASGNVARQLAGHEGAITSLSFSADNARLVSGSADKTVRVWNVADGAEIAKLESHAQPITAVAANSNGQQVVSAGADNSVKLWNVADGAELKAFAGHGGAVVGLAFTTDNKFLVSASADQTVRVWNPADGAQVRSIANGTPVTALAVSRDNQLIAAGGADNSVKLYNIADGKPTHTLAGHAGAVKGVAFSPDNTRVLSGAADNQALVWSAADGALLENIATSGLAVAAYGPAPNAVLLGTADKAIHLHTLRFERSLAGHAKPLTGLAYRADGAMLFSASQDGTVRGFQTANGQQSFSANHGAPVHALALSPNGQLLASAGENKELRVWNAGNGSPAAKPQLAGFDGPVRSVAFSHDNTRVAGGTASGAVLVFNVATGTLEQGFTEHTGAVDGLASIGEGAVVQFVSASADKSVRVWPLSLVRTIAGHSQPVTSLATLPTAATQILSGSSDGTVRHWNTDNGQAVRSMNHGGAVTSVAVRPDGQFFASAGANNAAKLWNAANGQQVAELKGDYRAKVTAAELAIEAKLAQDRVNARKTELDNATKAVPPKVEAAKKAAEALAAATKTRDEKKTAHDKVTADRAVAEKALAEADAAVKAATETAAKAAEALKADANNDGLKKAKADADKALADANAKQKAAADKLKTFDKPLADATKALNDAQAAVDNAQKAHELAVADQKKAEDAVPVATEAHKAAEAEQKRYAADLEAAQKAAAESEKPAVGVAFSPDSLELAVTSADNLVHTFDATTGSPFDVYEGHAGAVQAAAYAGPTSLATAGADKTVIVWNTLPEWPLERTIGSPIPVAASADNPPALIDRVKALHFSPDGKLLATGSGEPSRSGELKIWNAADGKLVREIPDAHSDTVVGVEFSPDGKLLASCSTDKFVKVFDVASGVLQKPFEGHTHQVLGVTWQYDGNVLVSCGADNVVKIWNYKTGEQQRTVTGFTKQLTSIEHVRLNGNNISNNWVISSGDKNVYRRQSSNGGNVRTFSGGGDYMYSVDITPDGNVLIAGGEDSVLRCWNGANGQVLRTFEPPQPPSTETASNTGG